VVIDLSRFAFLFLKFVMLRVQRPLKAKIATDEVRKVGVWPRRTHVEVDAGRIAARAISRKWIDQIARREARVLGWVVKAIQRSVVIDTVVL
jgi:hypothetical protein